MKHLVDLTNAHFDRIDFTQSKIIDFYCKQTLPNDFEFTVWGATILLSSYWKHDKNFLTGYEEDMYVSGIGTIKMSHLAGGSVEVYPYDTVKDEQNRTIVAKNHDGSELVYRKHWGEQKCSDASQEYLWECAITWPYGFCNLKLSCAGSVTFEFDTNHLIPVKEYLKNPMLYAVEREY